jgi:hypothetical protein
MAEELMRGIMRAKDGEPEKDEELYIRRAIKRSLGRKER